jgi:Flp pilus assembly protein TadG
LPQRKAQEGQAIVLIALLILVLFGMLGLAVDSGRSYVDRRDQQAAVDAAALAAGDWYDNYPDYPDLGPITLTHARQVYMSNLHIYNSPLTHSTSTALVGVHNNLQQDTWVDTFTGGYTLTVVATNTLFNGYQFQFSSTHQFPLAFMQIFGGPPNVTIDAVAGSIVGNQRQTPALLTLSTGACATNLSGNGSLTVLGDVYTNGTACVNSALHLAGNCYGAAGSTCSTAAYYCYNATPGFIPYPGPCTGSDIQGAPVVPAPSLPDPGYISPSWQYYNTTAGVQLNRGNYTEMTPGTYNSFALTGGAGCYFLDAGIYTWNGGYSSHGGLVSNELKSPNEELWGAGSATTSGAVSPFWGPGGCNGNFNVSLVAVASPNGMKHQGGGGNWGIELTSVRYDQFIDPTIGTTQNPCFNSPGCRRESAPSACVVVNTLDANNNGINITITANAPGAQYYLAYMNPNGCDGNTNNSSFVGRFLAPGWTDAGGPPATAVGGSWTGTLVNVSGGSCPASIAATVSICNISYSSLSPTALCYAQVRSALCQTPDDETAPQCFQSCPPSASTPQENAPMALQYTPYTGGDVANENYCRVSPQPGDPNAPCTTAKVTPGAVQFYFPNGSCMDQNGGGYTHVFSGEQYNWIIIYSPPGASCPVTQKLNGNAFTQYIGTIYTPSSSWDILGTDKAPLAGQVICYTASVTGNGSAGIDFNPNYAPAPPAARLIN